MKRVKSNCEAIIDAGNAAYAHGMQAIEHARSGDADSASAFARDSARSAVEAMRLVRHQRCCTNTHYPGESCATFGASESQIAVKETMPHAEELETAIEYARRHFDCGSGCKIADTEAENSSELNQIIAECRPLQRMRPLVFTIFDARKVLTGVMS